MKNLPSQFNSGRIPAAFANRPRSGMLEAARANVQASFAVVRYRAMKWRVSFRGETYDYPDPKTMPVIIIGVAENLSKTFYADGYVSGNDSPPDCFSLDAITSDPSSPNRQAIKCAQCPQNVWGSKTSGGGRAKACADQRRLAVVPAGDITNESLGGPMLLRLPPTSLANLANYSSLLERRGADFPFVITNLGFEDLEFPKITFTPVDWISDEQAEQVKAVMEDPAIGRMLNEAAPIESAAAPAAVAEPEPEPEPEEVKPEPLSSGKPSAVFGLPVRQVVQMPARPASMRPAFDGNGQRPPAEKPVEATSAPAPKGRGRPAATRPLAAPANLESAIDDLLGDEE
jgi:hypothetical protein